VEGNGSSDEIWEGGREGEGKDVRMGERDNEFDV
jgi:hypothetical protein